MVSLQPRSYLTPDGVQPIYPLRWTRTPCQMRNGCDTVAPQWDETVLSWRPSTACKLCFTEEEIHGPPLADIDPGFCCRCKKWKATECSACDGGGCGKCCKKRRGAICRRSAEGFCQCGPIEMNVECERAVRAAKAAVCAVERFRWQPSASSRTMRFPSTGNAPPLPVAVRESIVRVPRALPLRPAVPSGFSNFPNRFCCSLWCVGPPIFGGGNTY